MTAGDEAQLCISGKIKSVRIEGNGPTMFEFEVRDASFDQDDSAEYDKEEAKKASSFIGRMKKR